MPSPVGCRDSEAACLRLWQVGGPDGWRLCFLPGACSFQTVTLNLAVGLPYPQQGLWLNLRENLRLLASGSGAGKAERVGAGLPLRFCEWETSNDAASGQEKREESVNKLVLHQERPPPEA